MKVLVKALELLLLLLAAGCGWFLRLVFAAVRRWRRELRDFQTELWERPCPSCGEGGRTEEERAGRWGWGEAGEEGNIGRVGEES